MSYGTFGGHNFITLLVGAIFLGHGLYYMISAFVPELRPKDDSWRFQVNGGAWHKGAKASTRSIFILGASIATIGSMLLFSYTGRFEDHPPWLPYAIFAGAFLAIMITALIDNLPGLPDSQSDASPYPHD
jgi:hypothetical protein